MLMYIVIGIIIYLAIGVGLLIWLVMSDPWGGLLLQVAVPFILLYPIFLVWGLMRFVKDRW